jgi:hypothetical protein
MNHATTFDRLGQHQIVRNLVVMMAVALSWMIVVAATH